jgi:hypothetical protein
MFNFVRWKSDFIGSKEIIQEGIRKTNIEKRKRFEELIYKKELANEKIGKNNKTFLD